MATKVGAFLRRVQVRANLFARHAGQALHIKHPLGRDSPEGPLLDRGVSNPDGAGQFGRGTAARGEVLTQAHEVNHSPTSVRLQVPLALPLGRIGQNPAMQEELPNTLGSRLRELRRARKGRYGRALTQAEVAEHLHVSSAAIGHWERDLIVPDATNLVNVAVFYETSLDWLCFGEGYGLDAALDTIHETLRGPLLERLRDEIAKTRELQERLPQAFRMRAVADSDGRLSSWSAAEKIRQQAQQKEKG